MIPARKVAERLGSQTQVAALCYRVNSKKKFEVLLITSRGSKRWVPPKGWPIDGLTADEAAAQEAFEEAGVKGQVSRTALGCYAYTNNPEQAGSPPAEAIIFPLQVKKLAKNFKEKGQRKIKWFSPKMAAMLVQEPKLKKIIRKFDPAHVVMG